MAGKGNQGNSTQVLGANVAVCARDIELLAEGYECMIAEAKALIKKRNLGSAQTARNYLFITRKKPTNMHSSAAAADNNNNNNNGESATADGESATATSKRKRGEQDDDGGAAATPAKRGRLRKTVAPKAAVPVQVEDVQDESLMKEEAGEEAGEEAEEDAEMEDAQA